MRHRVLKLILGGSISPLIGVLVFLIQLQINPHGLGMYIFAQSAIVLVFLSYFFYCGYAFSRRQYNRMNLFWFFLVPFLLFLFNFVLHRRINLNTIAAILLLGIEAPFSYMLPYLYFSNDKYFLIPSLFPIVVCLFSFKIGEKVKFLLHVEEDN